MEKENQNSQIVIYKTPTGETKIDVRFDGDTVWLTQNAISELFEKGRSTVAEHIQNIFSEGELKQDSVCREFRRTGTDGKGYIVKYYNLDLIIAVGYRVKSSQGTAKAVREFIHQLKLEEKNNATTSTNSEGY